MASIIAPTSTTSTTCLSSRLNSWPQVTLLNLLDSQTQSSSTVVVTSTTRSSGTHSAPRLTVPCPKAVLSSTQSSVSMSGSTPTTSTTRTPDPATLRTSGASSTGRRPSSASSQLRQSLPQKKLLQMPPP